MFCGLMLDGLVTTANAGTMPVVGMPSTLHPVSCLSESRKKMAGYTGNSAVFFTQRYYERRPVRELLPLAAQLIVSGGKLVPEGIDGLEIVLCDANGIHRLSDDETEQLRFRAELLDESIRESLFG
jgi:hypothetical protein